MYTLASGFMNFSLIIMHNILVLPEFISQGEIYIYVECMLPATGSRILPYYYLSTFSDLDLKIGLDQLFQI